jgi:hypothetical protein
MIAIKITAPKTLNFSKMFIENAVTAINDTVDDTLKDFNATKKDFSDESQFEFVVKKAKAGENPLVGSVETDDENYVQLNNGFSIPGVAGKLMSFQPNYIPKTTPNTIPSRPGGAVGPRIVRMSRRGPTEVQARNFDLTIANKHRQPFIQRVVTGGKNG